METNKTLKKVTTKINDVITVETYDTMGNLIQKSRCSEKFENIHFVENWEYNEKNKEIHYISENLPYCKREEWYEYDENDRLVKVKSSEYPEGEMFLKYDEKGNIIEIYSMNDMGNTLTIRKKYNDLNEEIYCEYFNEPYMDFDKKAVSTVETIYTHHKNGKIARKIKLCKTRDNNEFSQMKEYDENGNCIHFAGVLTEEFFEYDEHNLITKQTTISNKISSSPNKTTKMYKNTYDADGDIIKVEFPDGKTKSLEYYDFE